MAESYYSRTIFDKAAKGDDTFVFDFDYVNQSDVHVSIDGEETLDFSFLDTHTIKLNNPLSHDAVVTVYRQTFLDHRVVDFVNAAELTEKDLDDSADQVFYAMQEAYDLARDSIKPLPDGSFSMSDRRLKDLATPVLGSDGANKDYVDAQYGINSALRNGITEDKEASAISAKRAEDAAIRAEAKADAAANSAAQADNNASLAVAARNASENARDEVFEKTDLVLNQVGLVQGIANDVASRVSDAEVFKLQAQNAKNEAENARNLAKKWAEESVDVPVASGQYSALHHATKAREWAEKAVDSPVDVGAYSAKHWAEKARGDRVTTQQLKDIVTAQAVQVEQNAATSSDASAQAVQAASNAALYASNALSYRNAAQAAATDAQSHAASALSSKQSVEDLVATVSGSEDAAALSAANAAASEQKAHDWAEGNVDVEVEPGEYSAKHWAIVAKAAANGARNYVGTYDASTGVLPIATPTVDDAGKYWVISVAGTLPNVGYVDVGYELIINENAVYESVAIPQVYTQRGNNLSDLTNKATARTNLGLGSVATRNVGTGAADIPDITTADGRYLGKSANAVSASKWQNARTLQLTGDVTGSVSIDGSKNVSLTATVQDDSHNHTIETVTGLQAALDSKLNAGATAVSAAKLSTPRTIALTGDVTGSVAFDGTSNVSITTTVEDDSHNHVIGNVDGLQAALDAKASIKALNDGLALKADTTALNAGLAGKVDTTTFNATKNALENALGTKASITELTEGLALKADTTALTAGLAGKVDTTTFNTVKNALEAALNGKAAASHSHSADDITSGTLGIDRLPTAVRNLAQGSTSQDPNNAKDPVIITNHANCPNPSYYWHITTTFYGSISASTNRAQLAIQYNGGAQVWARSYFQGTWTAWQRLDNAGIPNASKTVKGLVQLSDSINSLDDTTAATSSAVRAAYLLAGRSLGRGQTWQDVTGSRAKGTTYTNTTNMPIQILVQYEDDGSGSGATFKIDKLSRTTGDLDGGARRPYWFSAVIPLARGYSISGGINIRAWWELRE